MGIEDELRYLRQMQAGIGAGGDPYRFPATISFTHWNPPTHGDIGEQAWGLAFRGAQLAIAAYNAAMQQQIADKQHELAESWQAHAQYKWERFKGNYMPLEKQLLNEVRSTPIPEFNCADAESRAQESVDSSYDMVQEAFKRKAQMLRCCVDDSLLTDLNTRQGMMLVDSRNYNYDDDRWFQDYQEDKRWNRRSNVLALGRNLSAMALGYGQVASQIYGQVGRQMNLVGQSAMHALGYFGARNDTYIPNTYLGSGGQGVSGSVIQIGMPGGVSPYMRNPAGYP